MKPLTKTRPSIWFTLLVFLAGRVSQGFANPTGLNVHAGQATAQQLGAQLNVTVSQLAILNWRSFDIAAGETTSFLQPTANSIVFNLIGDKNPSQIFGNLNANGTVILANANGFYFGPDSMIKVGGSFIATTAPLSPDFGSGAAWQFTGMPPLASIVNYGQIEVGRGRSLFLIAENIENHGSLTAPAGNIDLAAGQSVLVSESPDGRGLSAAVTMPQGSVDNFGRVTADAGTIALEAKVVNQDGILQANSVQNQNGVIELVASDSINLGANSQILAQGDSSAGGSAGGKVTLKSENNFSDAGGSTIVTTGGANGGNGGNVEISAPNIQSLNSAMDASAQNRFTAGEFLLDPATIILGTISANVNGTLDNSGTVAYSSAPDVLNLNVNANGSFKNFSQIILQATGNIYVGNGSVTGGVFSWDTKPGITWNLSSSTGKNTGQLTLEAGGDIVFGGKSSMVDANNWSVTLEAGYSSGAVQSGTGNIYLDGGSGQTTAGSIQLSAGSISLIAGESILLASQNSHALNIVSGSVFTTGGGGIFVDALAGNIDAGTSNGGTSGTSQTSDYFFNNSGAHPNTVLGGISTKAGGNVTLIAGNNIDSTPIVPKGLWPGASGAYGAGDVTIIAGNQINGNYLVANGTGILLAGVQVSGAQAGALQNPGANPAAYATTLNALETAVTQTQNPNGNIGGTEYAGGQNLAVTLSLINGSWNAWAANNILLKEVNNPNGTFSSSLNYLYNYAPNAAANFWAGNGIELAGGMVGGSLARVSSGNQNIIYAPGLSLNAGAGGIQIDKSIILDPASEGSLQIITRDGGNLTGSPASALAGITMSDSGSTDYRTFGSGHAATPLHWDDPNPVTLDISGNIDSFSLTVPTFAQINVVGDTYNFCFLGQNLSAGEMTSFDVGQTAKVNMENRGLLNPATDSNLRVGGAITFRGNQTTESLTVTGAGGSPDPISASLFASVLAGDPALAGKLFYDATTGKLTYIGVLSDDTALRNPVDANGNPVAFDAYQLAAWQAAVGRLLADSASATLNGNGLVLSGPGKFDFNARTIDLGISGGIFAGPPINVATSEPLADPLPAALFNPAQSGNPELAAKLHYDSATGRLIFDGVMSPAEYAFLLNPTEVVTGPGGKPVTQSLTLDAAQVAVINQLYADNKNDVLGATINITTSGNLEMTSTKIANEGWLGGINLNVGGTLDVGGELTVLGDPSSAKGIFTASGGNISVAVNGNVNVDSSRIAAYNGGNVTVLSQTGDVNAGTGGAGFVSVASVQLDPVTGQLVSLPLESIPGSGILATTIVGSDASLGNITINAPQGSVNASLGGILQIAFNGNGAKNAFIDINAGKDINATGSGIIGSNIKLQAGGNIKGVIIGSQGININAGQNVNVTAVSGGNVNINASGTVAGTIVGGGDVSVSGDSIIAAVMGGSVSTSGDTAGASLGVPQANTSKDVAETTDATAATKTDGSEDDELNKKKKGIALAQKVSRVTVILPPKKLSENATGNNPL